MNRRSTPVRGRSGKQPVWLRVYDISNGKAATWSQLLLGHKIDGVWHTGVLVFGLEYFYGGGIDCMLPSDIESSFNMEIVEHQLLGYTTKTQTEFERFLSSLKPKFTPDTYDLAQWNCNHFTDTCSRFLLNDRGIPENILDLPETIKSTFVGDLILKLFKRMHQGRNPVNQIDDPHHPRFAFEASGERLTRRSVSDARCAGEMTNASNREAMVSRGRELYKQTRRNSRSKSTLCHPGLQPPTPLQQGRRSSSHVTPSRHSTSHLQPEARPRTSQQPSAKFKEPSWITPAASPTLQPVSPFHFYSSRFERGDVPNHEIPNIEIPNIEISNHNVPNHNVPNHNVPNHNVPNHNVSNLKDFRLESIRCTTNRSTAPVHVPRRQPFYDLKNHVPKFHDPKHEDPVSRQRDGHRQTHLPTNTDHLNLGRINHYNSMRRSLANEQPGMRSTRLSHNFEMSDAGRVLQRGMRSDEGKGLSSPRASGDFDSVGTEQLGRRPRFGTDHNTERLEHSERKADQVMSSSRPFSMIPQGIHSSTFEEDDYSFDDFNKSRRHNQSVCTPAPCPISNDQSNYDKQSLIRPPPPDNFSSNLNLRVSSQSRKLASSFNPSSKVFYTGLIQGFSPLPPSESVLSHSCPECHQPISDRWMCESCGYDLMTCPLTS